MRVLQINSVYNEGSTGRIVNDIHQGLLAEGNESYVIYARGKNTYSDDIVFKFTSNLETAIDGLETRMFNRHGYSNKIRTKLIIEKIKELNPDIIHLHNIHGYYINFVDLFKFLDNFNKPVIWLFHDQWPMSGGAAYFDSLQLDWNKPNYRSVKKLSATYPKYMFFNSKNAVSNYKKKIKTFLIDNLIVVTPSKWLENEVKNSFFKNNRSLTIYNGIDTEKFQYQPSKKINENRIKLLFVANIWDERKGLEYVIKLANDLPSTFLLTVIGLTDEIQKKLPNNIEGINRTDSVDELVEYYSDTDILVNPTLFDNFPTVNLEAQACGTPIITFDTGGSGESITKETGKIIKRGDYNALLNSVTLTSKKDNKIIENCVNNAEKYSKKNMVKNYILLYENVLEQLSK